MNWIKVNIRTILVALTLIAILMCIYIIQCDNSVSIDEVINKTMVYG